MMVRNYVFLAQQQHKGENLIGESHEELDYYRLDSDVDTRRSVSEPARLPVTSRSETGELK